MDSRTFIANTTKESYDEEVSQQESAFHATWQATDAALLRPGNLAIPKVQRAWDRRPLSPFSRQRLRVGKVWKRPTPSLRSTVADEMVEQGGAMKRRKARNSIQGPLKPVKKMCLASDFGMGARVLQWEGAESPVRKIVTRSNPTAEEMVALSDEDEEEAAQEEGDVTVEILDEDGTVLDVGGNELANEQEWEDEADSSSDDQNEQSSDTTVQLANMANTEDLENALEAGDTLSQSNEEESRPAEGAENFSAASMILEEDAVQTTTTASNETISQPPRLLKSQHFVLPDGFVSPAKRSRLSDRRSMRQSFSSRRKTLPVQFAPLVEEISAPLETISVDEPQQDLEIVVVEHTPILESSHAFVDGVVPHTAGETDVVEHVTLFGASQTLIDEIPRNAAQDTKEEQQWEDIEEESPASPEYDMEQDANETAETYNNIEATEDAHSMPLSEPAAQHPEIRQPDFDTEMAAQPFVTQQSGIRTETNLPSSPIPSIEGQHPRLPLRRSPRRKSTSPLKQSTILPSIEKSHLVAFTPLKTSQFLPPFTQPNPSTPLLDQDATQPEIGSPLERASSAPPEEPQMSPQKPSRPRVSDDTALLQAFLHRAAENKSSRRISATKRESITNRRDSDAVRQALASPAKADVLVDLDPNSPSPRKPSTMHNNDGILDRFTLGSLDAQEEELDDAKSGPTTRRGDRAARRAQPSTPPAPNKIAIRGNAENIFLKRSEAQVLANLTKNNTRKNRAGAVLPPIRLTKLMSRNGTSDEDASTYDPTTASPAKKPTGSRNVTWANTLVEFYQHGEVSEASVLSDELNAPSQQEEITKADVEVVVAPPPPSETPSKPKIRRLKPPRTAATPGKPPPPPAAEEDFVKAEQPAKQLAKSAPPTKRRSRIATPAKGLTNSSLLPSDVEPDLAVHAPTTAEKKPPPKKRAPISKLPAPSTAPNTTAISTSLGQGKENLISSPPKKRTVPTAKTFAPKLDFGSKTQLQVSNAPSGAADMDSVPGLMSPAKKGRGKSSMLGSVSAPDFGVEKDDVPGLSSPAKKRTRRAGV